MVGPCKMAKRLLEEKGYSFEEIDIEEKGWTREDLFNKTGGGQYHKLLLKEKQLVGTMNFCKWKAKESYSIGKIYFMLF